MKFLFSVLALSLILFGNASAATGYSSSDASYVKSCVTDAKHRIETIGATYSTVGGYDNKPEVSYLTPTFPPAFKNPVRPTQFIHPIEFSVGMTRGFQTKVQVFYSSAKVGDPKACVFQGISFLDQTDAN